MTIKQHGGVFGRNPTFNSVTVKGDFSIDGTIPIGSGGTGATTAGSARTALGSGTVGDNVFIATTASAAQQAMDVEVGVDVQEYDADTAKLDVEQTFTAQQTFNLDIVMADGKGIDFSATAGTGTSEIFADYEEGTFTPNLGSNSYGTSAVRFTQSEQEGYYIKAGSQVICWIHAKVTIASALGGGQFLYIFALPFTGKNTTYATSSGSAEVEFVGTSTEFIFLSFPDNSTTVATGYSLPSSGTGQEFIVEACLTYTV